MSNFTGIIEQERYTCAIGALQTVVAIPKAVPILHSGPGCGEMIAGFFERSTGYAGGSTAPCTNFSEKEVVFGGIDRLRDIVKNTYRVLDTDLQVIMSGCTGGIVGDDIESLAQEFADTGKPIRIIRRAETNLGDLCADAYLNQSGVADIAFVNGGGIRVQLNKGDLTLNDILRVHPFGNSLTVIEITGQQVLDALEWSVHSLPGEFGGFDQVAGITFTVDPTIPTPVVETADKMFDHVDETMTRRVSNVMVGGEPIDPEKIYKVASHDYQLLNEGDGYTMFKGANVLQESVKLDNQVLIDYITETLGGVVSDGYDQPYGQGRITVVGE